MGCVSSNAYKEDLTPEEAMKIATRQRRKLTLAPPQVGDITAGATLANPAGDEGNTAFDADTKLRHASRSRRGFVPYNKTKVNQDRAIVQLRVQNDPAIALFGVMDGHGEFGHNVASFVVSELPKCLSEQRGLRDDPPAAIVDAVKKLTSNLAKTSINTTFSGTTCVFGVLIGQRLHVANIGDSRCVLCKNTSEGIKAIALSEDQKPDVQSERERIIKAGGRVQTLPGPPGTDCGPMRVWLADMDVPGLAMSRSIGDSVSQTVGVISTPAIITHDFQPDDVFVLWASDGVWEFMSNEEVVQTVWPHRDDLSKATEVLIEEASKRWREEEEVIDDITCVILRVGT